MKTPQSLDELAFYGSMSPLRGSLEIDGDYDSVLISAESLDGGIIEEAVLSGGRWVECAFSGVTLDSTTMRRCRMSDTWFGETRFVAADLAESTLVDAWLSGCVLAGVQAFSTLLRRVSFRNCKLDSVNFREATLTDVTFEDCVLRDPDFAGAKLTRVRFPGCALTGASFTKATCSSVDLRGAALGTAASPGISAGYDALRGATIDSPQLMTLAPLLAHHLGITVKD
jgi:uncharacterized protein YjbI with pentapeptide repeats